MKKLALLGSILLLAACFQTDGNQTENGQPVSAIDVKDKTKTLDLKPLSGNPLAFDNKVIMEAYKNKQSDVWVEGQGEVIKLLRDDTKGSQHQRFLVKLSMREKQTLLFAHNIDLAPRINALRVGDTITFKGEYEYNPKGGVVHWTHHDPSGDIAGGWIKHEGKTYE